ncbi:hypothetical protein HNP33_002521 [Comamonas odontotermitis]|uniref:Uncharacterized protein n=1 Tax=Comamonas odontotermitis TaxID=379895 RepID=A0ABR6RHD3_9BURK|nr:hypothetical protein [Comamonas odontotermitis]MBB6578439.1 hypothetical protein [Comamonas odontotermitis]
MSTPHLTEASTKLFAHLPRQPIEKGAGCFTYSQGWQPSSDSQFGFYIGSTNAYSSHVYMVLEAINRAEVTFHLPIELLLPLARALVDAHHHLAMPPNAANSE